MTSRNATRLSFGVRGAAGALSSGAFITCSMRRIAVLASIMPLAANMIFASAVEMTAENTA